MGYILKILSFLLFFMSFIFNPLDAIAFEIKSFPLSGALFFDGEAVPFVLKANGVKIYEGKIKGDYVFLRAKGFRDKYLSLTDLESPNNLSIHEYKLERIDTHLVFAYTLDTGSQPKSIGFSSDGRFLVTPLLDGGGIEIFSMVDNSVVKKPDIPSVYSKKRGFVETLFLKKNNELWVSQMTTGMVHVFSSRTFDYKSSFSTKGKWPKVLTADKNEEYAFVSNWESKTVSIVKINSHQVVRAIKMPGIPRGMGVTRDNKFLYVAIYGSGKLVKVSLDSFNILKVINLGNGAPRHIVMSKYSDKLYLSDMYYGTIFIIDISKDKLLKAFHVGSNLNTIVLSPDERYLFISSRGKNSPEGYLHKGPEYGKIFVYDTEKGRIIDWTWGMNQPTGLSVSPDGKIIAFTDFLDNKIEIYNWKMQDLRVNISE